MNIAKIARISHEANCALQYVIGEAPRPPWDDEMVIFRQSSLLGVQWRLEHPDAPVSAQHVQWMEERLAAGWKHGPVKDVEQKTHPCLVPYDELPPEQRAKDALFVAIVLALKPFIN